MNFQDLDFTVGAVNPSGLGPKIFYAPKSSIKDWPAISNPNDEGATADKVSKFTGDFVMATGAKFNAIYSTQGKGKITSETIGETDMKMFVNKATIVYPRLTPSSLALVKATANGDFVFVIQHDGKFFVIGSEDYRNSVSAKVDSGDAPGSAKGVTIELECPDVTPVPIYVGVLAITGGSIDCSTGVVTATP